MLDLAYIGFWSNKISDTVVVLELLFQMKSEEENAQVVESALNNALSMGIPRSHGVG